MFHTRLAVGKLLLAEKCTTVVTALCSSSLCVFAQSRLVSSLQPWDDKSLHGHVSEWRSIYRHEEQWAENTRSRKCIILSAAIWQRGVETGSPASFSCVFSGGHVFLRVGPTPQPSANFFPASGRGTREWGFLSSRIMGRTRERQHFTWYCSQRHWSIIAGFMLVSFLEDRYHCCQFPICWKDTFCQWLLKYNC